VAWNTKSKDQKIETIRKYFLEPKILLIENLLKLTKNHIERCKAKIGELQEIRNLEKTMVTETKIEEIKEKIKKIQISIKSVKTKRKYKSKKLKRLLAAEWEEKEKYLTDEEISCYIRYGRKNN